MGILLCFGIIILCFFMPEVFSFILHLPLTVYYIVKDTYNYIYYKKYNMPRTGELNCYCGLFGRGKTLSMSMKVHQIYKRYNGKYVRSVYDKQLKKVNVVCLSNIKLIGVPTIHLSCLDEYPKLLERVEEFDKKTGTLTYVFLLIDEASVVLNSRNFAKNINADVLNSILTCRHYNSSMFYTSQRFNLTDKLLRDVTQNVYYCKKKWRCQLQYVYDAYELENASNPELVRYKWIKIPFVMDRHYHGYDTFACVENLVKDSLNGNMLTELEILQKREGTTDLDKVENLSRKGKRLLKRR